MSGFRLETLDRLGVGAVSAKRWAEDDSAVDIIRVTQTLAVISSRGRGHPGSRPFYAEYTPRVCCRKGSVIFWDLGGLTSTDLGVVSTTVGVGKDNRHNIAEVHMYYTSPMVGMAVTVANVALAGLIRLYRDPEPFTAAFDSVRASAAN